MGTFLFYLFTRVIFVLFLITLAGVLVGGGLYWILT